MKTLPDKSIDLFVCDLPYGCLTNKPKADGSNGKTKGGKNYTAETGCAWDIPIDLEAFWIQVKRLCKNDHTPVLMFCTAKFGYELIKSNEDWFRYDLIWNKQRGVSFLQANKMPMRSHELIYVFSKKGATYYRKDMEGDFPKSIATNPKRTIQGQVLPNKLQDNTGKHCVLSVVPINPYQAREKGQHPTQKPEDLYEWLITRYSKEGDTILDPTAGSFASCFTAQRLGRNAIGMEMDLGFYEKVKNKAEV
jgi:site-specific DNA-methyltransferase (adenine-specific)